MCQQRVDHGVAHEDDALAADALRGQVDLPFRRGHEERVGEQVGDTAVDLLGHGHVEGAQAGLHVRDRDEQLGAHQRRRQRGVDVAVDDHAIGRLGQERLLQRHQQGRRLPPWLPEPTPRLTSGSGRPSSSKKTSDMARS